VEYCQQFEVLGNGGHKSPIAKIQNVVPLNVEL
jgi:hypothetical protein